MVMVKMMPQWPPCPQAGHYKTGPLKIEIQKNQTFFNFCIFWHQFEKKKASPGAFLGYLTKYLLCRRPVFRIDVFLFKSCFFQNGDGKNDAASNCFFSVFDIYIFIYFLFLYFYIYIYIYIHISPQNRRHLSF